MIFSFTFGIVMAISGLIMWFTGEFLYGIIFFAICGLCLVGTDISLALKEIRSPKPDLKTTTELIKEMNKLIDFVDKDDN